MRLPDRLWLWRAERRSKKAMRAWRASPEYARIRACKHLHCEPKTTPDALAGLTMAKCLDCGSGIVYVSLPPMAEEAKSDG